jgi:hypothetical protein
MPRLPMDFTAVARRGAREGFARRWLWYVLFVIVPVIGLSVPGAAQITFRGRVLTIDSVPVYRAIVRLRDPVDSTVTTRVLTDEKGEFSFLLTNADETSPPSPAKLSFVVFPNPASGGAHLRFQRSHRGFTRLLVTDMLGREIATLVDGLLEAGEYEIAWDGRGQGGGKLAAGMYLAVLSDNRAVTTSKILITGSDLSRASTVALRRIGTHVAFGKTGGAVNILLDAADTTAALPRIFSKTGLSFHILSDTAVTIFVDYGATEDLGFPMPNPGKMRLAEPWLYVCLGTRGLWKRNVETMAPWQFLGLSDTTIESDRLNIVDADGDADTILAVSMPGWQKGLPRDSLVSIWKSRDGGLTWFRADRGIVETVDTNRLDFNRMQSLCRSPHARRIVLARMTDATYLSLDGGASWKYLFGGRQIIANFSDIMWNPFIPGEVWLGSEGMLEGQTDAYTLQGDTLKKFLSTGIGFMSVVFSSGNPDVKYAALGGGKVVYRSIDGGWTWKWFTAPANVSKLRDHPVKDGYLFESLAGVLNLVRLPEYVRYRILRYEQANPGSICIDRKAKFMYCADVNHVYRLFIGDY